MASSHFLFWTERVLLLAGIWKKKNNKTLKITSCTRSPNHLGLFLSFARSQHPCSSKQRAYSGWTTHCIYWLITWAVIGQGGSIEHRMAWVERDLKDHTAPTKSWLVAPHQITLPRVPSNLALNTLGTWGIPSFFEQPVSPVVLFSWLCTFTWQHRECSTNPFLHPIHIFGKFQDGSHCYGNFTEGKKRKKKKNSYSSFRTYNMEPARDRDSSARWRGWYPE